jgi:hypothetical protein
MATENSRQQGASLQGASLPWTVHASRVIVASAFGLVPHAESSDTGHEATKCCMKVCITSTISARLPENGVRSQRPVWRLTLRPH